MEAADDTPGRRRRPVRLDMTGAEAKALLDAADFGIGELLFRAETLDDAGNRRQAEADRLLARKAHFAVSRLQDKLRGTSA